MMKDAGVLKKIGNIIAVAGIILIIALTFAGAENFKYESHGKRDPFVPLLGQDKNTAVNLADITSADDLKLEGIATGADGKKTAIMNSEIVKESQKVGVIEIKKIYKNAVDVSVGGKNFTIKLSEEGGSK